jgi:hypothetical protein
MSPGELYVNVGFWSAVPEVPGRPDAHNRRIERSSPTSTATSPSTRRCTTAPTSSGSATTARSTAR